MAGRLAKRRNGRPGGPPGAADCDLVFADPDNGIRSAGHPAPAHRTTAVKHAYLDELAAFARRGQSLIVYHHADRSAAMDQQATGRLADLAREVPVQVPADGQQHGQQPGGVPVVGVGAGAQELLGLVQVPALGQQPGQVPGGGHIAGVGAGARPVQVPRTASSTVSRQAATQSGCRKESCHQPKRA